MRNRRTVPLNTCEIGTLKGRHDQRRPSLLSALGAQLDSCPHHIIVFLSGAIVKACSPRLSLSFTELGPYLRSTDLRCFEVLIHRHVFQQDFRLVNWYADLVKLMTSWDITLFEILERVVGIHWGFFPDWRWLWLPDVPLWASLCLNFRTNFVWLVAAPIELVVFACEIDARWGSDFATDISSWKLLTLSVLVKPKICLKQLAEFTFVLIKIFERQIKKNFLGFFIISRNFDVWVNFASFLLNFLFHSSTYNSCHWYLQTIFTFFAEILSTLLCVELGNYQPFA